MESNERTEIVTNMLNVDQTATNMYQNQSSR